MMIIFIIIIIVNTHILASFLFTKVCIDNSRSYIIVAPTLIRPDEEYHVHATILRLEHPKINVRVSINKDGVEYAMAEELFHRPRSTLMAIQVSVMISTNGYCFIHSSRV